MDDTNSSFFKGNWTNAPVKVEIVKLKMKNGVSAKWTTLWNPEGMFT